MTLRNLLAHHYKDAETTKSVLLNLVSKRGIAHGQARSTTTEDPGARKPLRWFCADYDENMDRDLGNNPATRHRRTNNNIH